MMTEKEIYHLEHQLHDWHLRKQAAERQPLSKQPMNDSEARHSFIGVLLRAAWTRLTRQTDEPTEVAAQVRPGTPPALALLRAVARGEVSPETANRLLSIR